MAATSLRQEVQALVTRPRAEAAELAAALAVRRIGAIVEPLIEIHYHDGPVPDLGAVQAVLCTSANGVRALARTSGERAVPLFAVGDATAALARAEGYATVESAGGDVGDLVRLVERRLRPEAGPLLHAAGTAAAGDLAGELGAAGFAVDRAVLYEARPVLSLSAATAAALAAGAIDLALFFSPRTAAIFAELTHAAGISDALATVAAVSISPAADAALGGLAFRGRAIAARPSQKGVLDQVDRLLAVPPDPIR